MKHVILMLLASAAVSHVAPALAEDPADVSEEQAPIVSSEENADESADASTDESTDDVVPDDPEALRPPFGHWICSARAAYPPGRRGYTGFGVLRWMAANNALRACRTAFPFTRWCYVTSCYRLPRY